MNNNGYKAEGWIYLRHKDCDGFYNMNEIDCGYNLYVSVYDNVVCDGYDGKLGKPADFAEKIYAEFFVYFGRSQEQFFIDEDGDEDSVETMYVKILSVKERVIN